MSGACVRDEHEGGEEATFVPRGALVGLRFSEEQVQHHLGHPEAPRVRVSRAESEGARVGLNVDARRLCLPSVFTMKQMPFMLHVPLHDFPVRVSGFRLDSQSSMYQGNMQITALLAEPSS